MEEAAARASTHAGNTWRGSGHFDARSLGRRVLSTGTPVIVARTGTGQKSIPPPCSRPIDKRNYLTGKPPVRNSLLGIYGYCQCSHWNLWANKPKTVTLEEEPLLLQVHLHAVSVRPPVHARTLFLAEVHPRGKGREHRRPTPDLYTSVMAVDFHWRDFPKFATPVYPKSSGNCSPCPPRGNKCMGG